MNKNLSLLLTPSDFNDAFLNKWIVEVWEDGEIQEYGGVIEQHTIDLVKINGIYYMKSVHEFRVLK